MKADADQNRATMVTAILPTMTIIKPDSDPRSPRRSNGFAHTTAASISSELTITPARFGTQSPVNASSPPTANNAGASASHLAGLVGMFTGCGALVALLVFLPLPTRFQRAGHSPATAVADAFYVVGSIAILVAIAVFFGLRKLPGEDGKGIKRLIQANWRKTHGTPSTQAVLSLPRQFWTSIQLGFTSQNIGLGYLGGFVARSSSVAISLFIPLFTNTYFLRTGRCRTDTGDLPDDPKLACPEAYKLAAALTGVSQLIALLCAPLFGYLSARYPRFNIPLLAAAVFGVAGYTAFGSLPSPDPHSEGGSGAVFLIAALLGISQIGAIVCSLSLIARGIHNDNASSEPSNCAEDSANGSVPVTPTAEEEAPLLPNSNGSRPSTPPSKNLNHLKGSIAGTYSLLGGFGILLLTKAGGALFDASGPGAPFFMMASFNALLLVVGIAVGAYDAIQGWKRQEMTQ